MIDISVQDKSFKGTQPIIENLSFSILPGEIVAFVGPSGAGKSTLLNLISGLDKDFNGQVLWSERETQTRHIGLMFQEPRLMPWLSVLENLMLVVADTQENRAWALSLLDTVGLADVSESFPGQLSGGMQKRVALARAFMIKPELLLLDEPLCSLDAPTAEGLRQSLIALCNTHRTTLVYVTHDLYEAISVADRILFFSPSPMRLILEHTVPIERPRAINDPRVMEKHRQLLEQYPSLLTGSVNVIDHESP